MSRIKEVLIEGKFFITVIHWLDYYFSVLVRKIMFSFSKVKNNKIFVFTFDADFNCNPSYIVRELIREKQDVDIVWVINKKTATDQFPPELKLVKKGSAEMFTEMASAKIWIDNAFNCIWDYMPKKKNQVYINTWHGSMGIKRLGGNNRWMRRARKANRYTDYCITNSKFEEDVFRNSFWQTTDFLRFGHARNDMLLKGDNSDVARKCREALGISEDVSVALYAPTFRDNNQSLKFMNIDFHMLKEALEKKYGNKWIILYRMHFKNRNLVTGIDDDCDWIVNASKYPDIQDLMTIADIGITDYSSWAYDYVLTKKPLFLYAPDIEYYNDLRGFYYPLESTPFPIAETNEELHDAILNFDNDDYQLKVEQFLQDKGCYETGEAAKKSADFIMHIIN